MNKKSLFLLAIALLGAMYLTAKPRIDRAEPLCWYTWNCSPPYARITSSLARLFVAFAGTKHYCLTAVNRDGALCCPDFPRRRGLIFK